jgi:transmembrane sensor
MTSVGVLSAESMASEPYYIAQLLLRLHRMTLSDADRQDLEAWIAESEENAALYRELTTPEAVEAALRAIEAVDTRAVRELILARMPEAFGGGETKSKAVLRRMPILRRLAVAAVAAGLLMGGYWLLTKHANEKPVLVQTTAPADIAAPATSRAMITLSSGQRVYLDSAGNGALARQGSAQVVKEASGQVAYKVENSTNQALLFNTLSNPRGSQVVTVTLSDGTKVWLNAESSIRYPAVFVGNDRTVEMSGEAYFEVAKNASKPFQVKINGKAEVEVLGTSFNVNAYEDEPSIKTTLLEGSVSVAVAGGDGSGVVLKPDEQAQVAQVNPGKETLTVDKKPDVEQTVAWKNGRFAFRHADLQAVMRQLSRWYNVDVSYEGLVPDMRFSGRIGSSLTLDQVLKVLTNSRVHYRIEPENKLIIQK